MKFQNIFTLVSGIRISKNISDLSNSKDTDKLHDENIPIVSVFVDSENIDFVDRSGRSDFFDPFTVEKKTSSNIEKVNQEDSQLNSQLGLKHHEKNATETTTKQERLGLLCEEYNSDSQIDFSIPVIQNVSIVVSPNFIGKSPK
eukprot:GHVP01021782.1.p2 GENE.GHVP01021782.1~~GHVP01021782.1.p2  ORF type:complete len:144 (+),score=30.87 GHVP01021782.1:280-711(+)